jgi:hypothetical protein
MTSWSDAEEALMKLSPLISYHEYGVSDFEDVEASSFSEYEAETITVEPCEMVVFQITHEEDFVDNWYGNQAFGLHTAAFVDSMQDESSGSEFVGHYAVRIPCNARPGSKMVYGEYDDGSSDLEAGLDLFYSWDDAHASQVHPDPWQYTIRVSFQVKPNSSGGFTLGTAFVWLLVLGGIGYLVYSLVL